jgi:hypothetical protein
MEIGFDLLAAITEPVISPLMPNHKENIAIQVTMILRKISLTFEGLGLDELSIVPNAGVKRRRSRPP